MSTKKYPRLHIFLGAGGVGKTTLSAGYALSLAQSGQKVGLLSIDPAKRLTTALGVKELPELGVKIPLDKGDGELTAALLLVGESLRRWVTDEGLSKETEDKLFSNPLFRALTEKFATATDTFAAVRMAEWAEKNSHLDDLVIDTAPGIHAVDFLAKPEKVLAFLDSKLIDWLKWFVGDSQTDSGLWQKVVKSGARKILDGLAQIGGKNLLLNLGEFLILLDQVFVTMFKRLEFARSWLRSPSTRIILVTAVRDDAVSVSKDLGTTLRAMGISADLAVINRSFPEALYHDKALFEHIENSKHTSADRAFMSSFLNFVQSYAATQETVSRQLSQFAKTVVHLPMVSNLDSAGALRISDLASLGDVLQNMSTKVRV